MKLSALRNCFIITLRRKDFHEIYLGLNVRQEIDITDIIYSIRLSLIRVKDRAAADAVADTAADMAGKIVANMEGGMTR